MTRPTWVTVVAVLGITFGCLGILSGGHDVLMPKLMEMQKEMFDSMHSTSLDEKSDSTRQTIDSSSVAKNNDLKYPPNEMFEVMQKMWEVPSWFGQYSIINGIIKALISAFYLLVSIWLLQMKFFSIRLFYWAAGLSIALSIVNIVILLNSFFWFGMGMMFGDVFGALIDIVLVIVVATGDKDAFHAHPLQNT